MRIDPAYQTVAPDDFPAMLEPARYARRSPHFEEIIARTEEHFWNPEDADYINFEEPWPAHEPILPLNFGGAGAGPGADPAAQLRGRVPHGGVGSARRRAARRVRERDRALAHLEP